MGFEFVPQHEQGDFNSGLAIIYRLDTIHKNIHTYRASNNFEQYYRWLQNFFEELVRVMNDKEFEEHLRYMNNAKNAYFEIVSLVKRKKGVPDKLLEQLYYCNIYLTRLEQAKGLGMPKKKDARYAL